MKFGIKHFTGKTIFLFSVFFASFPGFSAETQRCSNPYLATDFNGAIIEGSKAELLEAVQRGQKIRVGWDIDFNKDGISDLSHWSDADFLSVWEGEVFTQIKAIHRQIPVRGTANIKLSNPFTEWRGMLGSNGKLSGVFSSGERLPDMIARIFWCSPQKAYKNMQPENE